MRTHTTQLGFFLIALIGLLLTGVLLTAAQDTTNPEEVCRILLETFYTQATEACLGKPDDQICNGGNPPIGEPAGPIGNSLTSVGALVPVNLVTAITSTAFAADGSSGGLVWLRATEKQLHALLIGDVVVQDVTPQGTEFPVWHSMIVQTGAASPECDLLPRNTFAAQNSVPGVTTRIVVNGISLDLLGTALVQTEGNTTTIIALGGQINVIAGGGSQELFAGQQTQVSHNPGDFTRAFASPTLPMPFDWNRVRNFPVELLDRATQLPQPGFVSTEGTVNLRAGPSTDYGILEQIPPETTMTILGANPIGDWYHVRLPWGNTGWVYAELVRRNHGVITAIYTATPPPPQRYGNLAHTGRIFAPEGANLRIAPHANFASIYSLPQGQEVILLARSPYSPWVKVDAGGVIGWVALITLDTQAIVESLPVDYDVPQPPEPPTLTPFMGGGNAFPDPNCYPNCN